MTADSTRAAAALADLLHAASREMQCQLHVWRQVVDPDGTPRERVYRGAVRLERPLVNDEPTDAGSHDSPGYD